MRMLRQKRVWLSGMALLALGVGCGIAIRRDLSAVPPGQVGFDDMCGLQEYFDALEIKTSPPPRIVNALDLEGESGGKLIRGGREKFEFTNDFQLKTIRRVLHDNWRRLPEKLDTADKIELEVRWSEKAGTKRVTTDGESELTIGTEIFQLPYHPCLSELLYGEPLYKQRRIVWGLPLPKAPADAGAPATRPAAPAAPTVASAPRDGGSKDCADQPAAFSIQPCNQDAENRYATAAAARNGPNGICR